MLCEHWKGNELDKLLPNTLPLRISNHIATIFLYYVSTQFVLVFHNNGLLCDFRTEIVDHNISLALPWLLQYDQCATSKTVQPAKLNESCEGNNIWSHAEFVTLLNYNKKWTVFNIYSSFVYGRETEYQPNIQKNPTQPQSWVPQIRLLPMWDIYYNQSVPHSWSLLLNVYIIFYKSCLWWLSCEDHISERKSVLHGLRNTGLHLELLKKYIKIFI